MRSQNEDLSLFFPQENKKKRTNFFLDWEKNASSSPLIKNAFQYHRIVKILLHGRMKLFFLILLKKGGERGFGDLMKYIYIFFCKYREREREFVVPSIQLRFRLSLSSSSSYWCNTWTQRTRNFRFIYRDPAVSDDCAVATGL